MTSPGTTPDTYPGQRPRACRPARHLRHAGPPVGDSQIPAVRHVGLSGRNLGTLVASAPRLASAAGTAHPFLPFLAAVPRRQPPFPITTPPPPAPPPRT